MMLKKIKLEDKHNKFNDLTACVCARVCVWLKDEDIR